jgi:dsDNA-specific endonuclease/ATPase MutS2
MADEDRDDEEGSPDEVAVIELGDTLDLHHFRPSDVRDLVPDFVEDARAKGYAEVRIIHGKGTGSLRRSVHALLERSPHVASFRLADDRSAWGATIVTLHPSVIDPPDR